MSSRIPVYLAGLTFPSKSAAKAEIQRILHSYQRKDAVEDEQHVAILLDLVQRHPQADEKIGAGIVSFYVDKAPDWQTSCFYLRRVDGTITHFSFPEALSPTTPVTRLRGACRAAIKLDKLAFKDRMWPAGDETLRICPITGEAYGRAQVNVDHEPPLTLESLVEEWINQEGLAVGQINIIHTGDGRSEDEIADPRVLESWRAFHAQRARLRLTSRRGNLLQGSRELGR